MRTPVRRDGRDAPVVILGGGLTGLSAAFHLGDVPSVVVEREAEPGGLCRSFREDGFTFDCTGHLLHLREPRYQALVESLLPGAMARHDRRALVHSHGVETDYPFQANLHGLPKGVVKECVAGFVEALVRRERAGDPDPARASFREWVEAVFGRGIAAHFMLPYNAKLWRTDLEEIECGWVSWSIPRPTLSEVLEGALGATVRGLGYNPTFLYPRAGGIRALPDAFARRLERSGAAELRTGCEVAAIDARARTVRLASGGTLPYERLISTLPLDALLRACSGLPETIGPLGRALRAVRVLNICLGVDRAEVSRAHWIYFPEPETSFYRIGFPSNLAPGMAPRGCSSVWAERSLLRDEPFDPEGVVQETIADLRRAGILHASDRVVHAKVGVLDPAYVVYDRHRAAHLPAILATLRAHGIDSVGRFGAWEYASMEGAMRAGAEAADRARAALGLLAPEARRKTA
jgi:protoporphyrinogen oxidase